MSLAAGALPRFSLWHYVAKLLRLRFVLTISGFRRARLRRKIGMSIVALLLLSVAVGAFAASWWLLGFMRSPELAGALAQQGTSLGPFLENIPVLVLSGAFLGILLTSFGVLLQGLYLAGDMDFLLSAPVPIRAVFITKMLQAILPNFSLIALFGLPLLFGLGASGGYNFLYYPLVVIVLAMLALAAAGLSSLLVMGVVRIFPARRVAEVLGLLGAVFSILCSQTGNLMGTSDFANGAGGGEIPLQMITRFNTAWSPLAWAGRGLVDLGEGRWLTGIGFLALILALTAGLFAFSLATAERLYYTGWAGMQVSARRKLPARSRQEAGRSSIRSWIEGLLPAPLRAIVVKDLLSIRRDLRNLSQVITPIILGVVYTLSLLRAGDEPPAGRGEAPEWFMLIMSNAMAYASIGISLFVGWSLLSRLALMGFSHEGRSYWMLKTAPVGSGRLLTAKFLVAYLPSLALGWAFILINAIVRSTSPSVLLFGLAVVALSIAGTAGLNLAFGVIGANLTWDDPRRMNAGWPGCASALLSVLYLGFGLTLFFLPPIALTAIGVPEIYGQLIGLLLGSGWSFFGAFVVPRMVLARVARIGEE